jgi:diguanylate cyclase (GGDEF)-like protein/PAS domain S-box-containing protein
MSHRYSQYHRVISLVANTASLVPRRHNLQTRLLLLFIAAAVIPVAAITACTAWFGYHQEKRAVLTRLETAANNAHHSIAMYMADEHTTLHEILKPFSPRHPLYKLLTQNNSIPPVDKIHTRELLQTALKASRLFDELFVLDRDGYVRVSTHAAHEGQYHGYQPYFFQPRLEHALFTQPLTFEGKAIQHGAFFLAHPIYDLHAQPLGRLLGKFHAHFIQDVIPTDLGLGNTAETLLVGENKVLLTPPRDPRYAAGQIFLNTTAIVHAFSSQATGTLIADDYRGVKSVIAYQYVPSLNAVLLTKQDYEEAFARVTQLLKLGILFGVIAVLFACACALLFAQRVNARLKRLTQQAEHIASGNFITDPTVDQRDELGTLAHAFNIMAEKIGKAFAQINAAKRYTEDLIEGASVMIIKIDEQYNIKLFNRSAEEITGYTRAEMLGRSIEQLFGHRRAPITPHHLGQQPSHSTECAILTKHGHELFIAWRINRVVAIDGSPRIMLFGTDVTERRAAMQQLEFLAHYDSLTQLPNRTYLQQHLDHLIDHVRTRQGTLGVIFIDLDRFKSVNDTLGHKAGDQLLITAATRLREAVRQDDVVGRISGDEFLIILPDLDKTQEITPIAEKILRNLAQPLQIDSYNINLSATLGISRYPRDADDAFTLIRLADTAMYHGKKQGRGQIQYYHSSMNTHLLRRLTLETEIRRAIEREEFEIYYQPQFSLHSWRAVGAEALVRWNHPEHGLLLPDQFIGIAEETGLISQLGEWVLRKTCEQLQQCLAQGLTVLPVAINISAIQFKRDNITKKIDHILTETRIASHLIELELTESILMDDTAKSAATLQEIHAMGIQIAIDDFGTGYSSLSYLKRFPVTKLKIDQSFVHDFHINADDAAIAKAIIALGHSLGMRVIAEGVEHCEELLFLRDHGCDEAQGYLFSRPVNFETFIATLKRPQAQTITPLTA